MGLMVLLFCAVSLRRSFFGNRLFCSICLGSPVCSRERAIFEFTNLRDRFFSIAYNFIQKRSISIPSARVSTPADDGIRHTTKNNEFYFFPSLVWHTSLSMEFPSRFFFRGLDNWLGKRLSNTNKHRLIKITTVSIVSFRIAIFAVKNAIEAHFPCHFKEYRSLFLFSC